MPTEKTKSAQIHEQLKAELDSAKVALLKAAKALADPYWIVDKLTNEEMRQFIESHISGDVADQETRKNLSKTLQPVDFASGGMPLTNMPDSRKVNLPPDHAVARKAWAALEVNNAEMAQRWFYVYTGMLYARDKINLGELTDLVGDWGKGLKQP